MIFRDWQVTKWMVGNWLRWKFRRRYLVRHGLLFKRIHDIHPVDLGEILNSPGVTDIVVIKTSGPESFVLVGNRVYWQTTRVNLRLVSSATLQKIRASMSFAKMSEPRELPRVNPRYGERKRITLFTKQK